MRPIVAITMLTVLAPLASQGQTQPADPFAAIIRNTAPLSAEEEQRTFRLPEGFEIQLVAAEPDIAKPMNLAFDHRGRLWVSESIEYPMAAPADRPGRDKIKILDDTNGDGKADKITTFADGLNIPIGVYPFHGGAIAFSIPNIWRFEDTNNDDIADRRVKLYGPMGFERDTHGMNNAFRRGFDGWLYACHGFNNETRVKGRDGHEVHMQSGNTYRMRMDGERIEQFTWGQVNPFGMALDGRFNLFTADCHSKPIYQLLRGGYYPSFGKPHDGLGFVRPMMNHTHGSTAIAGVAVYEGDNFPQQYRGNLFSGNVMTSRINRNLMSYQGSTIHAKEQIDFLSSSDPWFRPVDVRVGPDGALYIADFYNRIIGHYEVALDHPGRDRHRGRIWRVVYKGKAAESQPARRPAALADASTAQLITALDHPSLTYRMLAMDQIVDARGVSIAAALRKSLAKPASARQSSHLLWCLFRLRQLDDRALQQALASNQALVRIHAAKILAERKDWPAEIRTTAIGLLADDDAFVRRAASDAIGRHPAPENIVPLLSALRNVPASDDHLSHTIRISLRNQLREPEAFKSLDSLALSEQDLARLTPLCLSLRSAAAARFLTEQLATQQVPDERIAEFLQHAVRYSDAATSERLSEMVQRQFADNLDRQAELLQAMMSAVDVTGGQPGPKLKDWGRTLGERLIEDVREFRTDWTHHRHANQTAAGNPWGLQARPSTDGDRNALFLSSLVHGETLTGTLRSKSFSIPATLSFYLAGHNGPPSGNRPPQNFVRLRETETGRVLREQAPPRNDVAALTTWKLEDVAGRRGYLEIVDGDNKRAYAWLAIGRFQPHVVKVPARDPAEVAARQLAAIQIATRLPAGEWRDWLTVTARNASIERNIRSAAATALARPAADPRLQALAPLVASPLLTEALRQSIVNLAAEFPPKTKTLDKRLSEIAVQLPSLLQQRLSDSLASRPATSRLLLELVEQGKVSAQVLLGSVTRTRLEAQRNADTTLRIGRLTANLKPRSEATSTLIRQRLAGFDRSRASAERGGKIFTKHCAVCHQIGGQGKVVGPQLDGIGNRGLQRLLEDLLDPNRNVDVAFRTSTLVTGAGKIVSGLVKREEGQTLVLIDNQGKELRLPLAEIDQRKRTNLSLMPDNMATIVGKEEFNDLISFLLGQRAPARAEPR